MRPPDAAHHDSPNSSAYTLCEENAMRQMLPRWALVVAGFLSLAGISNAQNPVLKGQTVTKPTLVETGAVSTPEYATAQSVMQVDEQFRVAKLNRDTAAINRILADVFYDINQNGHARDKAQFTDLWKTFAISTLTTDSFEVRLNGDTATVSGSQTENGNDRMLFLRVYLKNANGWQLVSSMQSNYSDPVLMAVQRAIQH
jgi:hypothetical protein